MSNLGDQWADLARGAALGLAVAAPIGPISMLCIQRTLAGGARVGLATGYGVATTHLLYACIASAGLAVVADFVAGWGTALQLCCAALLLCLAMRTVRHQPVLKGSTERRVRPWLAYATGLAWTLGNPMTLMGFFALTPSVLGREVQFWQDLPVMAAGVLLGSASWWTMLVVAVACARRHLGERGLRLANLATAVSLACFALVVLAGVVGSHVIAG